MYCTNCHYGSEVCRMERCPQCQGTTFTEKPGYGEKMATVEEVERYESVKKGGAE